MKTAKEVRVPLTKARVLEAAVLLADAEGVASLSMRRLAKALEVEAMSLYHHVADKDEVLDGMVDLVFAEIGLPSAKTDWRMAMRDRAVSVRDALLRHRWAVGLVESRKTPGLATLRHHDAVLGSLRRGGFTVAGAAHAFSLLDSYIFGFVLQELNLPFGTPDELEQVGAAILGTMPTGDYPHLTELMTEHALKPGYRYADEFGFGLGLILAGLEELRDKQV